MSGFFGHINVGAVLLGFGILVALWVLWKIQRSPKPVDLVDLILDESGRASWTRICAIGAFLFSTWAMAHLELTGRMDSTYFGLYLGTFVGGAVAYQYRPCGNVEIFGEIRVQAPAGQAVGVQVGGAAPPSQGTS